MRVDFEGESGVCAGSPFVGWAAPGLLRAGEGSGCLAAVGVGDRSGEGRLFDNGGPARLRGEGSFTCFGLRPSRLLRRLSETVLEIKIVQNRIVY